MRETLTNPLSRAGFLKAGTGLVVACGIPASLAAVAPGAAEAATGAPGRGGLRPPYAPVSPASLDSWLAVAPDGSVTVFTGRNDSGQGKETSFAQIVAEELDVPFKAVTMVMADTARTPDQGGSFASDGLLAGAKPLRHAAAEARQFLVRLAAQRFGVAPDKLVVKNGVVSVAGNPAQHVTYGQLIGGRRFDVALTVVGSGMKIDVHGTAPLKPRSDYTLVGTSVPRVDIPAKVDGSYARVQNVRIPGMLHGRIIAPDSYGAELLSVRGLSKPVPGVVKIVRKGNFLGVVAQTEWAAIEAAAALQATWSKPEQLVTGDIFAAMRSMPTEATVNPVPTVGDVDAALAGAPKTLEATYNFPIQNHGMIGPSCAVVDVRPGEVTIYSGTQFPAVTRSDIAKMLGVPLETVRLIWHQTSGCYGRMTMDDAASAAALLSAEVGKPVRVQFSRHEEHAWEPHIAPFTFTMRAGLNAQNKIVAWHQDVWTWGLGPQAELPWLLEGSATAARPGRFAFVQIGGGDMPMYAFPNQRSVGHPIHQPMVRSIDMRSPGYIQGNFANESFMDELAAAAGQDPIAFRIAHSMQPRGTAVLQAVAKLAKWEPRPSPAQRTSGPIARGRGVAVVSGQKSTWIATVAEVEVNRLTGVVRPTKMYVAVDSGLLVNPDGLRNQVEGATLFGTSRALKEQMTWDASGMTSKDWSGYHILRFTEVPDVEIAVIDRIEEDPGGVGEAPNTTPSAAIGNAIFDATGARVRQVPFTPDRVSAALAAG